MTEFERIDRLNYIRGGRKTEYRNDFFVDENRKKVWAIIVDLYKEFERVCVKHGLEFFTDGGTTLGAIRHEGFIPWDDDMDVCMPRASYEKLKLLASEFKHPYFLQSAETDPNSGYSLMKLRNCETLFHYDPFSYTKYNQGMFLDIIPLDKVTIEDYVPRRRKIYDLIMKNSARMRKNYPNKSAKDLGIVSNYFDDSMTTRDVWREIENIATVDENENTGYLSLLVTTIYRPEQKFWPARIFDGYEMRKFENIEVRVPKGWDEQLKIYFGDYMKFPPVEERGNWHPSKVTDPDVPYKKFYQEKIGLDYSKMQAVILAAGMGSRLSELTKERPKCLVPVKGKPLLLNTLDALATTGRIEEVFIVVGYKAEMIKECVGEEYKGMKINYLYNDLYATTNNVLSLAKVGTRITEDCLLLECDLLYTPELINQIINKEDDCNILVSKFNPETMNGSVVFKDAEDNVTNLVIKKRQLEGFDYSNAYKTVNIYRFKQAFFNQKLMPAIDTYIRSGNLQSYYELVIGSLIYLGNDSIKAVTVDESQWFEIDDMTDLRRAEDAK